MFGVRRDPAVCFIDSGFFAVSFCSCSIFPLTPKWCRRYAVRPYESGDVVPFSPRGVTVEARQDEHAQFSPFAERSI
ncbi:hypothetical protein MINT15_05860 [Saccharomonospora viridis]|uniref:Uncharacterized protein n=1 Tax=Saccharomonospora viridis TaxID=1852 RepID=A0A837DBU6_9PSEU|nr:hypothetical protein MINT15_05860 [Saccharomonospora viridis]